MVICCGRPMASAMPTASFSPSVFVRRKFLQQVRPVASHDTAYFVIDDIDVVERLNLHADPFKVLWAERAAVQEFHWHTFAPPRGRRHRVQPGDTGIGALPGHQEHRKPSTRLPTEASGWRSKVRISIARACATAWTVNVQPRRSGDDGAADCWRPQRDRSAFHRSMTWRASFRAASSAARFCMSSAALRPRLRSGHRTSGCNLVDDRRILIAGARLVDAPLYRPHAK